MARFTVNISDAEKEAFMEAARKAGRNAPELVREFMRGFVEKKRYEAYVRIEIENGLAVNQFLDREESKAALRTAADESWGIIRKQACT